LDSNDAALHSDKQELQRALRGGAAGMRAYLRDNANFFRDAIRKLYDTGKLAYGEISDLNEEIDTLTARVGRLEAQIRRDAPLIRNARAWHTKADRLDAIEQAVNSYTPPATPAPSAADINYLRNL
jgi:hypothetical protein